jgi:hypothetical protein
VQVAAIAGADTARAQAAISSFILISTPVLSVDATAHHSAAV